MLPLSSILIHVLVLPLLFWYLTFSYTGYIHQSLVFSIHAGMRNSMCYISCDIGHVVWLSTLSWAILSIMIHIITARVAVQNIIKTFEGVWVLGLAHGLHFLLLLLIKWIVVIFWEVASCVTTRISTVRSNLITPNIASAPISMIILLANPWKPLYPSYSINIALLPPNSCMYGSILIGIWNGVEPSARAGAHTLITGGRVEDWA